MTIHFEQVTVLFPWRHVSQLLIVSLQVMHWLPLRKYPGWHEVQFDVTPSFYIQVEQLFIKLSHLIHWLVLKRYYVSHWEHITGSVVKFWTQFAQFEMIESHNLQESMLK